MLVSLKWIKQYTDLPEELSMQQLAYDLTMRTVEVEGWEDPADSFKGVIIGEIKEVSAHPNADKLRVCQVDVGKERDLQIVCGGTNLYPGELVVVSAPGAMVRWHGEGEPVEIKPSKLRGVLSEGMICASDELDLGTLFPAEDSGIIMDLTDFHGAAAGKDLADVLDYHDMIIDIDNKSLTNRPDLWGHYGMARELAAIYGTDLKPLPAFDKPEGLDEYEIEVEDQADCPRFTATVWHGLYAKESPYELRKLLHQLGHSSHGLIVDLSNYVMFATGQPNHTYDLAKVGERIEVRRAREGEKLELLDDINLELTSRDLVIASHDEAIGLAGIKGGKDDSISDSSSDIVLEIASFNPQKVRKTARTYDVHTDASARFEKGLDQARIDQALGYFQALIHRYFPEAKLVAMGDTNPQLPEKVVISCSTEHLEKKLGRELNFAEVESLLEPLGYELQHLADGTFLVGVPSWRATGDVEGEADIVEELARMIGYENFSFLPVNTQLTKAVEFTAADFDRQIREFLAYQCGLQEVYVYPWVDINYQQVCGLPNEDSIALADPPSPEEKFLNISLVPALLRVAKQNEGYSNQFGIFNSGLIFKELETEPTDKEGLPKQERLVAGLLFGQDPVALFREAKGILELMIRALNLENISFEQAEKPAWSDPQVWLNLKDESGEIIGQLGLLSAYARQNLGFKRGQMAIFEFELKGLKKRLPDSQKYEPIPQFPVVDLDFTVLCPEKVSWAEIERFLAKKVYRLEFVGEWRDQQLPEGYKSLTFRVYLSKPDGTLDAEEIEAKRKSILNTLEHALNVTIRDF
ncbi:MAG: phenylalanine--tRNA ligase subunit beta [Eubacteriales bacterium]|nr:phenylalanine--tRNA ligase subunit beta [Eubacteriales bacterium]